MPEWLLKTENYIPQSDKDTFINKSILSLLSLLSRIRAQSGFRNERFHINVLLKVAFTILIIVLLSVSQSFTFIVIVNIYILFILGMMKPDDILKILKVSIIVALFTFFILIPAAFRGNYYSIMTITPKVFATVTAINILSHSTSWSYITSTLKTFFVPDIFIFVLDITIKYLLLLGEFSLNMLYSLKLRSVGKNKYKYTSLSGIAGTMFIKSTEMAEEMHTAMECRGFTGEYRIYKKFKYTIADFIFTMINAVIIFIFIYLR